jgi:hypothetical protein
LNKNNKEVILLCIRETNVINIGLAVTISYAEAPSLRKQANFCVRLLPSKVGDPERNIYLESINYVIYCSF